MAVYLVDTENTSYWWTSCCASMRPGDKIILFYTEHSNGLFYGAFNGLSELDLNVQFVHTYCGPASALDFQLASYLGYLISKDDASTYYIVANDAGYDVVVSFWKKRGVDVLRIMVPRPGCHETMSGDSGVTAVRSDVMPAYGESRDIRERLGKILSGSKYVVSEIAGIIDETLRTAPGNRRAIALRNALTRTYGLYDGSAAYALVREYTQELFKSSVRTPPEAGIGPVPYSGPETQSHGDQDGQPAPESGPSGNAGSGAKVYTWDEFVAYVNTQQLCSVYRTALLRDFPDLQDGTVKFIMAAMAWAVQHAGKTERIKKVWPVVCRKLPGTMSQKKRTALRTRLGRKLTTGAWPGCLTEPMEVDGLPAGLK